MTAARRSRLEPERELGTFQAMTKPEARKSLRLCAWLGAETMPAQMADLAERGQIPGLAIGRIVVDDVIDR